MTKRINNYQVNQSAYNQIPADYYHQNWGDSWKDDLVFIDKFISLLSGKTVVDIGAGTGGVIKYFLDKELKPTYVDFSDSFLNYANQNLENIEIIKSDMRDLPFQNHIFDGVFTRYCLQHLLISDYTKAIKELIRITKHNGYIYLCTHVRDANDSKRSIFHWPNQNVKSQKNLITIDKLLNHITKFNLELIDKKIHYKNKKVNGISLILRRIF